MASSGCSTTTGVTGGGPTMAQAMKAGYDGPKARVAVVRFLNKTAHGGGEFGSGLSDMLISSMFQSDRFIMLDRSDLGDVVTEQDFAAAGRISEETAAAIGQIEGADLLVMGSVTEFEKDQIGVGGILIGILSIVGSVVIASKNDDAPLGAVTYKQSHVAMDLKVVDARTGRVVHANNVTGTYQDWGGGIIGGVGGGRSRVPVGLGGFAGTGAEQAIKKLIKASVGEIVKNTPTKYYREITEPVIKAGRLAAIYPVALPDAKSVNLTKKEALIIDDEESYGKLLGDLGVAREGAPDFDWKQARLIATFAGSKKYSGHRIAVDKAIHHKDHLEIQIREVEPEEKTELAHPETPFDIARIHNPGKPIRIVWK